MRILCVDPDHNDAVRLRRELGAVSPEAVIHNCRSAREALDRAGSEGCDVLLTEIDLGESQADGFVLAQQVAALNPAVNIIFVTGRMDSARARLALELHASGYVRKPCTRQSLAEQFRNLRHGAG